MPVIEQIIYCKSILNRMMLYNPMLIPSKKEKKDDYNDYPTEFYSISKNSKNQIPNDIKPNDQGFFTEDKLKKMAKEAGIKLD